MRVWQISSFGIQELELVNRPIPEPQPGDVTVQINAVSLNYRDLRTVLGTYNPKMELPRIPCSDGAGVVVAVGHGVTEWKVGDRVAGIFMQNWLDGDLNAAKSKGALGGDIDGTLAEYVAFKASGLVRIPDHLTDAQAATLPCAGVTAWNALFWAANTKPGSTVVIQGTGGVSIFALQFAKLAGARVLGTSGSEEKLAQAKSLGLDGGLNYKTNPDWDRWVLEETNGVGADVIVEVGGAGTLPHSLKAIRHRGVIAQIGVLAGAAEPIAVPAILHKQVKIHGIYVGSHQDFSDMNKAIAQHKMVPVVGSTYSFEQAKEAFTHMEDAAHFGKIVIQIGKK